MPRSVAKAAVKAVAKRAAAPKACLLLQSICATSAHEPLIVLCESVFIPVLFC